MNSVPPRRNPFSLSRPFPWTLVALCLGLSACNLAPDYKAPTVDTPAAFKEAEGSEWGLAKPDDTADRGAWWQALGDPQLNALEEQVQVSNQSIAAAEAAFRTSRSLAVQARASLFPVATAAGSITRQRSSQTYSTGGTPSAGKPFTQYDLPIDASYTIDLWGRIRNTVSASVYSAQASAADLASARLSIQAELASDYFALRAVDEQRRLYDQTVASYQKTVELTRTLVKNGIDSEEDLATAQTQLDQVIATATDLGIARAQYEHAIAVLIGKAPGEFALAVAPFTVKTPQIPAVVPSTLLQRRPDIAAAERRVAAANAQIGIARSAYYPNITLGGYGGFETSSFSKWFNWPSRIWSIGPQVGGTVFDVGGLRGVNEQAQAEYDVAVASYRQTVLGAFQSVEDNLVALNLLSKELGEQQTAVASAQHTLELTLTRYKTGIDSFLNVANAQTTALNTQQTALQVELRQVRASISLIVALGGGWDVNQTPTRKAVFEREPRWTPAGDKPASP